MTSNTEPELLPCPNGCSSAGEVWNGDGLEVCPVCHGNTVVSPPKAEPTDGAPETIWIEYMPSAKYEKNAWLRNEKHERLLGSETDGFYAEFIRKATSDEQIAELEADLVSARRELVKADNNFSTARNEALEEAASLINDKGANEQMNYGLNRGTQNYFRARDAIRALKSEGEG